MNGASPTPDDPGLLAALERGVVLFNEQQYLEAYEVWQERWQLEISDATDLLQGLIQMAVGFAKLESGNPKGTVKLLTQARDRLMVFAPSAFGLDIDGLLVVLGTWRKIAEQMVTEGISTPGERPKLQRGG